MANSRRKPRKPPAKPKKPRPDFPLFAHRVGQWASKMRYFGPWSDPDVALAKYTSECDKWYAGRNPRQEAKTLTIKELCNVFLNTKRSRVASGELARRTFDTYHATCTILCEHFDQERPVDLLTAKDFESLRGLLAKTRGAQALSNEIQRVRTVFLLGFATGLTKFVIPKAWLEKPKRKEIQMAKHAAGARMFEAKELTKLLAPKGAKQPLPAMIMLGVNCGFGQGDITGLTRSSIDLAGGWINFPRPKTGVPRLIPLWPKCSSRNKRTPAAWQPPG